MSRQEEILDAAGGVFLRYGYRKTSMDDVAHAAGLSRQGLYLHFRNKERLFHAVVERMTAAVRVAVSDSLSAPDADVEQRLLGVFEALTGGMTAASSDNIDELLQTAARLSGQELAQLQEHVVAAVAELLDSSGAAARWSGTDVSATDLAEMLYAVHAGLKHMADAERQRELRRAAIRLVTRGSAG